MKKAKGKAGTRPGRGSGKKKAGKPLTLQQVRETITQMVGGEAEDMAKAAVEEAKKGHLSELKYLFEMSGLYPAASQPESAVEDSLAKTLLRRLRLPEESMLEAESEKEPEAEPVAVAGDAVE